MRQESTIKIHGNYIEIKNFVLFTSVALERAGSGYTFKNKNTFLNTLEIFARLSRENKKIQEQIKKKKIEFSQTNEKIQHYHCIVTFVKIKNCNVLRFLMNICILEFNIKRKTWVLKNSNTFIWMQTLIIIYFELLQKRLNSRDFKDIVIIFFSKAQYSNLTDSLTYKQINYTYLYVKSFSMTVILGDVINQ